MEDKGRSIFLPEIQKVDKYTWLLKKPWQSRYSRWLLSNIWRRAMAQLCDDNQLQLYVIKL